LADRTLKNPAKKPSVTSHPLFPAIVVVWCAALFGLVSLAIRPALIESLVLATGIDHVIAKAAPPLGHTAHMLIVLAMTGLGAVVGLAVARRLSKPAVAPHTRNRHSATIADADAQEAVARTVPAVVSDEEEDEAQPIARRRRQLAILDEEDRSFEDHAPIPGTLPANGQILDIAELPLKSFDEVDGIWLHESDHTTFRKNTDPVSVEPVAQADDVQGASTHELHDAPTGVSATETHDPDETSSRSIDSCAPQSGNRLFDTYVRRLNAGVGTNDPSVAAPGFVSLKPTASDGDAVARPTAPLAAEPVAETPAYGTTADRIASAPLNQLSHVELLERLAQTIARRRAQASQPVAAAAVPQAVPEVAVLPRFAAPQVVRPEGEVPAALRPQWAMAQDDDDDEALPAYVPARSIAVPRPAASGAPTIALVGQAHDDEKLEDGYSSLLGMSKPALDEDGDVAERIEPSQSAHFAQPGRREDPLASTIPASVGPRVFDAPQADKAQPDQTEQALRAALATLRRMSGTA
jgi:hypothetical protein